MDELFSKKEYISYIDGIILYYFYNFSYFLATLGQILKGILREQKNYFSLERAEKSSLLLCLWENKTSCFQVVWGPEIIHVMSAHCIE